MAKSNSRLIADLLSGNADEQLVFEGSTQDDNETVVKVADPTADRTITYPDDSGVVALTKNTVSNSVFQSALANTNLAVNSTSSLLANTNNRVALLELDSGIENGGFVLGTITEFPGTDADADYLEGVAGDETYVGESGQSGADAFGISLQSVYDNMDPIGRMITEDLGSL